MKRIFRIALLPIMLCVAMPAAAQMPPPTTTAAMPFLKMAGEGDIYEIASSQIALMRAQNPEVRAFASMMTDHHTRTSNSALAAAKAAGVMPPPAILGPDKRDMITQLLSAPAADFDRTYLTQQQKAHEAALALNQSYASRGDTAELRTAAQTAVPVVQRHLDEVKQMMGAMR